MVVVTLIERQKERLQSIQGGGHVGLLIGHREVHQCPTRREQGSVLGRFAIHLVLLDGIRHRLGVVRLELQGGHRDTVRALGEPLEQARETRKMAEALVAD